MTAARSRYPAVLLAACSWLVSVAAVSVATGDYDSVPLKTHRGLELIEDSAELESLFKRRGLRYVSPAHEDWLMRVAHPVLPAPTDPYIRYRIFLLRDPSPNAFALPDGQIYVHTGMLARLQDEAQLAALLAHEISHVAGHHGIVTMRSRHKNDIGNAIIGGLLLNAGGYATIAGILHSVGSVLGAVEFSQELEAEADRKAFRMLRDGGYDAAALPELFALLGNDPESIEPRLPTKWNSHPELEARVAAAQRRVERLSPDKRGGLGREPHDFHDFVRPLALMSVRDYIQRTWPRAALALALTLQQRHPNDAQVRLSVGDAYRALGPFSARPGSSAGANRRYADDRRDLTWEERVTKALATPEGNENQAINLDAAARTYRDALTLDPDLVAALRGLGDVYMKQQAPKKAARSYMLYLTRSPQAPDRKFVLARLKKLTAELKAQSKEPPS